MRLDKLLSNLKYGSRKDIKMLCKKGFVQLNGKIVKDAGIDVTLNDEILLDEKKVYFYENLYLVMNKPQGYVSSNIDEGKYPSLLRLIKEPYNRYDLNICGRLDVDTEGLVLLTTDGNLLHQVITPKKDIYKKYYVKLKNILKNYEILENGVEILDGVNNPYTTKQAFIEKIDDYSCYIMISEGKFHQVKRMFLAIDNEVVYLKRVAIGNLELPSNLELGTYQLLTLEEVQNKLFSK